MAGKSVKSNFFFAFLFDHFGGHFGGDFPSDQKFFDAEIFGRVAFEGPRSVPASVAFALRDHFADLDGARTHAVIWDVSHFDSRDQLGDGFVGDGDLCGDFGVDCFHVSENADFFTSRKFFFNYFAIFFSERGTFFLRGTFHFDLKVHFDLKAGRRAWPGILAWCSWC